MCPIVQSLSHMQTIVHQAMWNFCCSVDQTWSPTVPPSFHFSASSFTPACVSTVYLPNPTKMCVTQKLNQLGRTWVVKKLYSELFLILSRSSKSTPVLRPWEVRWLQKTVINFHNMEKNHPWDPCWGRKTKRKAAKMVSTLVINRIYIGIWFYLKSSRLTNRTVRMALSEREIFH